jgi:hypothetical protein
MNDRRTVRPFGIGAFLDLEAIVKIEERIEAAD